MANPIPFPERVAAELRSEMAYQQKSLTQMSEALELDRKATKLRYDGKKPLTLSEVETLASWLHVELGQLLLSPRVVAALDTLESVSA